MQTIEVPIDDKILAQLDDLVPVVSDSEAVRELGIVVTRETVARLALVRGLQDSTLAPPPPGGPSPVRAPSPKPPNADSVSVETTEPAPVVDAPRDNAGMIRVPDGWHLWRTSERIPESQADIPSYYDRQGWRRYWGKSNNETMTFYWSPDPSLQDVEVYDGVDTRGKTLKIQETPYGPGHLIPHGWGAQ